MPLGKYHDQGYRGLVLLISDKHEDRDVPDGSYDYCVIDRPGMHVWSELALTELLEDSSWQLQPVVQLPRLHRTGMRRRPRNS